MVDLERSEGPAGLADKYKNFFSPKIFDTNALKLQLHDARLRCPTRFTF